MDLQLKGGHTTHDPRLDRIYEPDLRSLNYLVRGATLGAEVLHKPRSYTWSIKQWLDQGQEGACVGFGYAHDLAARPVVVNGVTDKYAREAIYWRVQREDPWEGGSYPGASPFYEGTSVLTGAKVMQDMGYYTRYEWGVTAEQVAHGLGYNGPCVFGFNWYSNMFDTDANGFIHPTGELVGGHCLLGVAVKIKYNSWYASWFNRRWSQVDLDKSYITLHNSWGRGWGVDGQAKLTLRDLAFLLKEQGEACFPVRNPLVQIAY